MRLYYLLVIILIIIIALVIIYYLMPVIKKIGGDDLDYIILDEIKELTDVSLSGVISHLEKHFKNIGEYSRKKDEEYLLKLINKIINKYNINNHEDFIAISALSQKAVLPREKACFLCKRTFKIKDRDIRNLKRIMNEYLIKYEMYWNDNKVTHHARDLLTANRMYKFKNDVLKLAPSKIKKMIKNNEDVFEVDLFAIRPVVRDYVYTQKNIEKIKNREKNKRELESIKNALLISKRYSRDKIRNVKSFHELAMLLSGRFF